jgi:hypothetical protein
MAIAAAGGAIAAIRGLNAWKSQSVWAADNDLARRILITLYRYRDSLFSIRHPAMYDSEMKVDDMDSEKMTPDQKRQQGVILAYVRRWERHQPVENELDALLQEANAVWGGELSSKVAILKSLQNELFRYIRLHLDAHYRGPSELAKEYRKILQRERNILYDLMNEDDVFRIDFAAGMKPVETYLRKKLGREQ